MPAPIPLPLTWKLLSLVVCPTCGWYMHFDYANEDQMSNLERDLHCPNPECGQHGITYQTRLQVDGLTVIGVKQ